MTIVFTLSESHMSIHTWPEYGSCAIDFYNCGDTSKANCAKVREYLCQQMGEHNVTSDLTIPRGQGTLLATNSSVAKMELYKNATCIHREVSEKQKIEVFDIPAQGKTMLLNNNISVVQTQKNEDQYSENICKLTFDEDCKKEKVLIIGGGDLMQASCILKNYPQTEKIVVCDWDPQVTAVCEEFFGVEDQVKESLESGRLIVAHEEGEQFVNDAANQSAKFDIVIVDSTNYKFDDNVE